MGCRPCCCLSPRVGAIVVGILDLFAGALGLVCVAYLVYIDELERRQEELDREEDELLGSFGNLELNNNFASVENDLRGTVYSLFYPTILTIITGLVILLGSIKGWRKMIGFGVFCKLMLVFGSIAVFVICKLSGITWYFLAPHILVVLFNAYPLWAVVDYFKSLKSNLDLDHDTKNYSLK